MSNKVFIAVINNISGNNRLSFSLTLPQKIVDTSDEIEKSDIEKGIIIKRSDEVTENHLINNVISFIKSKDYWSDWMDNWTSASLYLLYTGQEQVSM